MLYLDSLANEFYCAKVKHQDIENMYNKHKLNSFFSLAISSPKPETHDIISQ